MPSLGMHIGLQNSERRSMYLDCHVASMKSHEFGEFFGQVLKCCFCGNFFPWMIGRVEQVTKTLGLR